jgi:hypothetical protein
MYPQIKLRPYICADCGIPCKRTSPNAEHAGSAGGCARTGRAVSISRRCWDASGLRAISQMLSTEPQLRP